MKYLLPLIPFAFAGTVFATPTAKLPVLNLCYQSNGSIVVRQRCPRSETTLSAYNIGGLGIQGQQGPAGQQGAQGSQGPAGAAGGFDPAKCHKREGHATGRGVVIAQTSCLSSEILVAQACNSTSEHSVVRNTALDSGENQQFPDSYGIFQCMMEDWMDLTHTVTAQAVCCGK